MRFVLSRRWALFALTVVLLAFAAYLLGQWQFHRLHEKRAANHRIAANLAALPVPVDRLMSPGKEATKAVEWRRVVVTGHWDDAHTVVLKYQTNDDSESGVHVATPLVTSSGAAVVVDRGWMSSENSGNTRPKLPPVTSGEVTVLGWVRVNGTGGATAVDDLSTRALSSATVAKVVPYRLYGGFVDLDKQSPAPAKALERTDMPSDTGDGPHFFYGLQWYFFGALAIFGFFYLMYDEWKRARTPLPSGDEPADRAPAAPPERAAPRRTGRRRGPEPTGPRVLPPPVIHSPDDGPPSECAHHAAVDREHDAVHE